MRCFVAITLVLLGSCLGISQGKPVHRQDGKCGYASCDLGKPGMINVHIVPHTHDDVGWLKTVDQYYYGYKNNIQHASVRNIIDTVVQQLRQDIGGSKRFIYVEIAYFYRWWNEQPDAIKTVTKQLVDNGNLQFILGGWCMNDEAATHYTAIIDQHTIGLKFLSDNFGECGRPLVAWQIDPFGHSREQANLFAQMGFDGLYFFRLDYQDKAYRRANKNLELIWNGNEFLPGTDLFTGILNDTYCPPPGFCFDDLCSDDPIMDDKRMHDYNVKKRVDEFLERVKYQAKYYSSNNVMIPAGCDFYYQNARAWYSNLDKLIKYANARQANGSKYNLMYSTPSCYTFAVNQAKKVYAAPKKDDFFPYADGANSFWSGYFTSRAALKYMVRKTNAYMQSLKQLSVWSKISRSITDPGMGQLSRAMGVLQHHDAVSGTEKQAVAYDYAQRLSEGIAASRATLDNSLQKLTSMDYQFVMCPLLNISACNITRQHDSFSILIYNPASQPRSQIIRFPISDNFAKYIVSDYKGMAVQASALKVSARTLQIPEGKYQQGHYDLIFQAQLPALGYQFYTVRMNKQRTLQMDIPPQMVTLKQPGNAVFSNGLISLTFDGLSGLLLEMRNIKSNVSIPLQSSLKFYTGYQGNGRHSGAYVFRPNEAVANGWSTATVTSQDNGMVKEIFQEFTPWATLVYRLYLNVAYVEVEWTVGPIPYSDNVGREVILHYKTPFKTSKFYTDANGRQLLQRQIDHRATWDFQNTEQVAGNYFPINSRIVIKDEGPSGLEFVVLTDRSEGGGSHVPGELEIMLHRMTMQDDNLGVGEPLKEMGSDGKPLIVRGRHIIYVDKSLMATVFHRQQAALEFMQPQVFFSTVTSAPAKTNFSALKASLPMNVQLLTMENWLTNSYLVRFEHIYAANDDASILVKPITIDLSKVFNDFKISKIELMSLAANQKLSEMKRLPWTTVGGNADVNGIGVTLSGTLLTLKPMAIATLVIGTE